MRFKHSNILLSIICLLFFVQVAVAQDEDEEYMKEYILGLNFNTNGGFPGGFMFRYTPDLTKKYIGSYQFELVNVRYPKEIKYPPSNPNGSSFIYGKTNYLFSLRSRYCIDKVLFKKDPNEGVQINMSGGIGPTIGIVKPYFILYRYSQNVIRNEPFNPAIHSDYNRIEGNGGLLTGFGQSSFVPGLNAKLSLSFEFGAFNSGATGIEVGFCAEAFTKTILIYPSVAENRSFYTSGFINIYYGWRR